MVTVEERVSFLEGRTVEQSNVFAGIWKTLASLERRMDGFEERVDRRFDVLDQKLDQRFAWLIGIQITTTVAVLGLIGAVVSLIIARS